MRPTELIWLAWLSLTRRPVRTALSALGLTVAVAGMVVFLSLGEGLKQAFSSELSSIGPDLQVSRSAPGQSLLPSPSLDPQVAVRVQRLAAGLGIERVTPVAVILRQSLDPAQSAVFYGLPPDQGIAALFSGVRASSGRLLIRSDAERSVAVLGARAARNLGLAVGDTLPLTRRSSARVVGVLQPENSLTDTFTFLPLGAVQRAFGSGNRLSLVAVTLRRPAEAGRVAAVLSRRLGLEVSTRSELLRAVERLLSGSGAVSLGLSAVSLLIGSLTIINTVMMGVFERTREFGTLRAIGARPGFVRALVLSESLLLALLGGSAGLLLGLLGSWGVNLASRQLAGIDVAALTPRLTLLTLGISLLLGLLAGLIPARAAGRLTITRALGRA